jgi:hypothetical protein
MATTTPTKTPEILLPGVVKVGGWVFEGRARKEGEIVQYQASTYADRVAEGIFSPMPRIRALKTGLMCLPNRVLNAGEEGVCTIAMARQYHRGGSADWLNPRECGETLPERFKPPPAPRPPLIRVRVRVDVQIGDPPRLFEKGQVGLATQKQLFMLGHDVEVVPDTVTLTHKEDELLLKSETT